MKKLQTILAALLCACSSQTADEPNAAIEDGSKNAFDTSFYQYDKTYAYSAVRNMQALLPGILGDELLYLGEPKLMADAFANYVLSNKGSRLQFLEDNFVYLCEVGDTCYFEIMPSCCSYAGKSLEIRFAVGGNKAKRFENSYYKIRGNVEGYGLLNDMYDDEHSSIVDLGVAYIEDGAALEEANPFGDLSQEPKLDFSNADTYEAMNANISKFVEYLAGDTSGMTEEDVASLVADRFVAYCEKHSGSRIQILASVAGLCNTYECYPKKNTVSGRWSSLAKGKVGGYSYSLSALVYNASSDKAQSGTFKLDARLRSADASAKIDNVNKAVTLFFGAVEGTDAVLTECLPL